MLHFSQVILRFACHHGHPEVQRQLIGDQDLPLRQKQQQGPMRSLELEKKDKVFDRNTCEEGSPDSPWFTESLGISGVVRSLLSLEGWRCSASWAPLRRPKN